METKIAAPVLPRYRPMPPMSRDAGLPVPGVSDGVPLDAAPLGLPAEALGAGVGGAVGSVVADDKIRGLLQGLGVGAGVVGGGRLMMPDDGEPDLKALLGALAGGGLGYVGGSLAADAVGRDGRRGGVLDDDEEEKAAATHPALTRLLLAKTYSDQKQYLRKHAVLRQLLADAPADFFIDSRAADGIVGLTHRPTSFRIHMPGHMMPAGVALAEEIPDPLEKAANRLLGLLRPVAAPVGRAAATANEAIGTAASAAAAAAPAAARGVGRAAAGYAREMGGYGPNGPLAGQRMFDASTVKPRLTPAQYRAQTAAGATREQLAATHQLPEWWHRLPGMATVGQIGNRLNRNPVLHPVVQAANTAANVASTPVFAPLTRPLARTLAARGQANVAAGGARGLVGRAQQAGGAALTGLDKAVGQGSRVVNYGALGVSGYYGAQQMWRRPAAQAAAVIRAVPGATTDTVRTNPEYGALYDNPLPAAWDGLTDRSELADLQRAVGRRHLPYTIRNQAAHAVAQTETDPFAAALSAARGLTPGGFLTNQAVQAVADPTPAPTDDIVREEVRARAPGIFANYDANLNSPTGQRLVRLLAPVAQDPWVANASANLASDQLGPPGTPLRDQTYPARRQALDAVQAAQPDLDLGAALRSPAARALATAPGLAPQRAAAVDAATAALLPPTGGGR